MKHYAWPILLLTVGSVLVAGCEKRGVDSTQQQQRALDSIKGEKWYDADKMAYRTPPVTSSLDDVIRTDGWKATPKPPPVAPPPGGAVGTGGASAFFSVLIWVILGTALIGLALLLIMTSMRSWNLGRQMRRSTQAIEIDPTRVVDLPFEAQEEMRDPLDYARQLVANNDYDAAVLFLYGYMLLALDRAGKIVLHRGKTNRMYLFELSGERRLRELLTPTMLAFEEVFFGRHPMERIRFLELWRQLDEFHRELAPIMASRQANPQVGVEATSV
ncbi:MAG: hypothetical protein IT423_08985 [Pirellulaceae bacterium]|nr:hypothetical protein [Pirellulaceae bacterium]